MKKLIFLFILFIIPKTANADESGKCGDNLTWTYVEATQTLIISGNGEMYDYSYENQASWRYKKIKKTTI